MNKGKILKGVGGFYYVLDEHNTIHECKARGRFRKDGIVPLPGDNVLFNPDKKTGGFIEDICERKNELIRPRVTNVDMVAIVVSAKNPKIDFLLCDKLLVSTKKQNIMPLIVINKCDLSDDDMIISIHNEYKNACQTIRVSAKTKDGLDDLKTILKDRCTCLAGQSAAGKSSILNALFPGIDLETGVLSKKTERGRHTTRHAELLLLDGFSGTVVDTPGFSFFADDGVLPEQLAHYYDDMKPYAQECRFNSCLHAQEPDCGVKHAVQQGKISQNRYQRDIPEI